MVAVTNIHNNSQTYRPYEPGLAIGDTTPTIPDPPPPPSGDDGCGVQECQIRGTNVVSALVLASVF